MKTEDLTGPQLAQWVAKALGYKVEREGDEPDDGFVVWLPNGDVSSFGEYGWRPDLNGAYGAPLIEQEEVGLIGPKASPCGEWQAAVRGHPDLPHGYGDTALIAAMRAIVFSKFGAEVPEEP